MQRTLLAFLLVISLFTALPARAEGPLKVAASFSILADIAHQIGGDKIMVTSLVPPNGDAHVFQPTPKDAKVLAHADLVIFNGFGFEGWMERLLKQAGSKATIIIATKDVSPRELPHGEEEHHGHGHDHDEGVDPHAWQSIPNVLNYVATIRDGLMEADKENADFYRRNANKYLAELRTLDAWIRAQLGTIPAAERKIITNHDAFGYFAKEYELTIMAAHGIQTETEPTAAHMARLIKQIKEEGVKAVFIENISDARLMKKLEKEAKAKFGGKLYSDALSDKPPADTYIGMMRWNATAIVEGLR